jgi:hypothetical protein
LENRVESLFPDTGSSSFAFASDRLAKPKLGSDTSSEEGQLIRTEVL